jgi:hypothetical protein
MIVRYLLACFTVVLPLVCRGCMSVHQAAVVCVLYTHGCPCFVNVHLAAGNCCSAACTDSLVGEFVSLLCRLSRDGVYPERRCRASGTTAVQCVLLRVSRVDVVLALSSQILGCMYFCMDLCSTHSVRPQCGCRCATTVLALVRCRFAPVFALLLSQRVAVASCRHLLSDILSKCFQM